MSERVLEMSGICKSFPGVKAVDNVALHLDKGEVLALVGENGAGKSTLMKILSGAYRQDSGSITIEGETMDVNRYNPIVSIRKGISVIYQELNYLGSVSVAENIYLGALPHKRRGFVDYKKLYSDSMRIQQQMGLGEIDPLEEVGGLLTAQKQLIEIARAFARKSKIIVMDEPTASLTDKEIKHLYKIIDMYKSTGGSVIFITHKLEEIFAVCDSVMVMRDGKLVMREKIENLDKHKIISAMVGRELDNIYPVQKRNFGENVLEVSNLSTDFLKDISFQVRKGEIVGLYGLMGSGCEEITKCIYGIVKTHTGSCKIAGKEVKLISPANSIKSGISYVPSERKTGGLMLNLPVKANMTIANLRTISQRGMLRLWREEEIAHEWVEKLDIKTPDVDTEVDSLSGGNQQKVVFAKCMNVAPKVLLLNEPTRGVDVGAKAEIYKLMEEFCENGLGILMASSEMPETMAICDRIIVVHNGRITAVFENGEAGFDQMSIMRAVLGE